jgi:hypothetical protein
MTSHLSDERKAEIRKGCGRKFMLQVAPGVALQTICNTDHCCGDCSEKVSLLDELGEKDGEIARLKSEEPLVAVCAFEAGLKVNSVQPDDWTIDDPIGD